MFEERLDVALTAVVWFDKMIFGHRLDSMSSEIFSNLTDSTSLWHYKESEDNASSSDNSFTGMLVLGIEAICS